MDYYLCAQIYPFLVPADISQFLFVSAIVRNEMFARENRAIVVAAQYFEKVHAPHAGGRICIADAITRACGDAGSIILDRYLQCARSRINKRMEIEHAAQNGHAHLVNAILTQCEHWRTINDLHGTAFESACIGGYQELAQSIIARGKCAFDAIESAFTATLCRGSSRAWISLIASSAHYRFDANIRWYERAIMECVDVCATERMIAILDMNLHEIRETLWRDLVIRALTNEWRLKTRDIILAYGRARSYKFGDRLMFAQRIQSIHDRSRAQSCEDNMMAICRYDPDFIGPRTVCAILWCAPSSSRWIIDYFDAQWGAVVGEESWEEIISALIDFDNGKEIIDYARHVAQTRQ